MARPRPRTIELIDNSGPNTIPAFLERAVTTGASLDIAAAFITEAGLDRLEHLLSKAGTTRVITGLYQSVTEPGALRRLLRLQRQTKGRISVRLAQEEHFHWKAYFLVTRTRGVAIVGSSNLTAGGLGESGELNMVVMSRKSDRAFLRLHRAFGNLWERGSVPFGLAHVRAYQKLRRRAGSARRLPTVPLSKVLGPHPKPGVGERPSGRRYWCIELGRWMTKRAETAIAQYTSWDRKDWDSFSIGRSQIQEGDRAIFISRPDHCVVVAEIMPRPTRLPVVSPEGRRFAPFKDLRGHPRRALTDRMWEKLKEAGLVTRKRQHVGMARISEGRFRYAAEVLRRR